MKKLLLLLLCFFLVSCNATQEPKDYFLTPRCLYVTFDDGTLNTKGVLQISSESLTFSPDIPKGMCIELDKDGGNISYNGLMFEGELTELSRFRPLLDAVTNGTVKLTYKKGQPYPSKAEGTNFTLSVHKELSE